MFPKSLTSTDFENYMANHMQKLKWQLAMHMLVKIRMLCSTMVSSWEFETNQPAILLAPLPTWLPGRKNSPQQTIVCSKLASFVSRYQDWVGLSSFHVLISLVFGTRIWLVETEKISSAWKVKSSYLVWNISTATSQHEE